MTKLPILKNRIRKVPKQFSWIDHRLVRDRHIEKFTHPAAALYLFLVTVGDVDGLSYYGDKSVMKRLCMDQSTLQIARSNLIQNGMIAWQKPIYQVLSLDISDTAKRSPIGQPLSLGSILKKAREEAA
ncbi:MAG: hypothetical protein WBA34_11270 [Candidatus Deferrimicrobiaceae bacterium]